MSDKRVILGTAAIVRNGDKYLIAQRKSDSRLEANMWEFPGGKVEFMEDPKDTIVREIKEEIDLVIAPVKVFDIISAIFEKNSEQFHIVLIFYECRYISGEIRFVDCQDARWITKDQFDDFTFAKADVSIVERLKREK